MGYLLAHFSVVLVQPSHHAGADQEEHGRHHRGQEGQEAGPDPGQCQTQDDAGPLGQLRPPRQDDLRRV